MYKFVIGHISDKRQADWFCKDDNPYSIYQGQSLVSVFCCVDAWRAADNFLRDHIDVDWGSVAWKANKQELTLFFKDRRWDIAMLDILEPNKDYAVVFIESAGEF